MAKTSIKNSRRIFSQLTGDPALDARVIILESNELKVTYFSVITGTSGTITPPSQATFNANEFGLSGNAILSEIDGNGKPTFQSPKTLAGTIVTATLDVNTGAWLASGVYTSSSIAIIYSLKIETKYYSNLTYANIIESESEHVRAGVVTPLSYDSTTDRYTTLINTNRLAGRTTASSGVIEEIEIGAGIRMSNLKIESNTPYASTSGTDTYTATISPAITSYTTGDQFNINFVNANTGASTLNLNSLGAKSILNSDGSAVTANTLSNVVPLVYNGTAFQIIGGSAPSQLESFNISFDGQGGVITINANAIIPATSDAGQITGFYILSDVSGSIEIDMKKNGTSMIGAGTKLDLVSASSNNSTISGWTTDTFNINDKLEWVVSSATTITKVWLTVKYNKTS